MPYSAQPFPRFFVIRPDHTVVPLVALDELPPWLRIGNWNWSDPTLFQSMCPASLSPIPRLGEYNVTCYHCRSSQAITQNKKLPLNPEAMIFDPAYAQNINNYSIPGSNCNSTVYRHNGTLLSVTSLSTTECSSPATNPFSFESISSKSRGHSSLSSIELDSAVARLREVMGIGERDSMCPSESGAAAQKIVSGNPTNPSTEELHVSSHPNVKPDPESEDVTHGLEGNDTSSKRGSQVHKGSKDDWKGNNNIAGERRARKALSRKERNHREVRTEDVQGSQHNTSSRRRGRRTNTNRKKSDFSTGSRYWHMMTIPNWRDKTPQR